MSNDIDFKQIALLSLYGLSMIWSPVFGTTEAMVFPTLAGFGDEMLVSRILNLAAYGLAMAAISVVGERVKDRLRHLDVIAVVVTIGCAGMLVGSLVGMLVLPIWWLYPSAIARGLFGGVITVLWIDVLVHLKDSAIGIAASAALALYALSGLIIVGITAVFPPAGAILLICCTFASCIGCIRAHNTAMVDQPVDEEGTPTPRRTQILLCAANFVFGIPLGALLCHFAFHDNAETIAAFLCMAVVLAVVFNTPAGRFGPHSVYRGLIMLFAIATPVVILVDLLEPSIANVAASAALAVILLYNIIIFSDTQARLRKPYWKTPGRTQFFAAFGMIVSAVAIRLAYPEGVVPGTHLMLLAMACMLFVAAVFSPSTRTKVRPWGFSSLAPEEPYEIKVLRRCSELAEEHKLTSRELEILQLLVAGSTRDDIASTFVISPATVKTHIRNIYAKLGIHSQRELMNLIESA